MRINLDDTFLTDGRTDLLAGLSGEMSETTMGRLVRIYFECYRERTSIRTEVQIKLHSRYLGAKSYADLLVEAELAVKTKSGEYRIRGVEDRIEWLKKSSEAGKKSAAMRANNPTPRGENGKFTGGDKNKPEAPAEPGPNVVNENNSLLEPKVASVPGADAATNVQPLPLPLSNSLKKEKKNTKKRIKSSGGVPEQLTMNGSELPDGLPADPPPEPKSKASPNPLNGITWEAYRVAHLAKYGHDPVRNPMVNSMISQLVKRLGSEAPDVVRFYVSHPKSYYVQQQHTIGPCLKDCEALRTQWKRSVKVTHNDAKQEENKDFYQEQMKRLVTGPGGNDGPKNVN